MSAAATNKYQNPALSVVIPAYNEAARLTPTLQATVDYLDGRGLPFEILVVDDGSRDATISVAEAFAADYAKTGGNGPCPRPAL